MFSTSSRLNFHTPSTSTELRSPRVCILRTTVRPTPSFFATSDRFSVYLESSDFSAAACSGVRRGFLSYTPLGIGPEDLPGNVSRATIFIEMPKNCRDSEGRYPTKPKGTERP